jgi:hypothetical protein
MTCDTYCPISSAACLSRSTVVLAHSKVNFPSPSAVSGLLKISCWRLRLHTRRPGRDGLVRRDLEAGAGPDEKVGMAESQLPTRPTLRQEADAFGDRDRHLDS